MFVLSLIAGLVLGVQALPFRAFSDKIVKGGVSVGDGIQVQDLQFFYKMDAEARYLDLKNEYQSTHRGEFQAAEAESLAIEAYQKASVDAPFARWLYHGGAAPNIFTGKLHLYNAANRAMLNVPYTVTVRIATGDLRVSSDLQMTDFAHLKATRRWQTLKNEAKVIPVFAPSEDMQLEVMSFNMLTFQKAHPNQWPTDVEITVRSPQFETTKRTLQVVPDHFVVPVMY